MQEWVFINYRHDDDGEHFSALLNEALTGRFGRERIFRDHDSIEAGADFTTALRDRVRGARVMVAVITPRWLELASKHGRRRIDDPDDWVRIELAAAIEAGVPVIPVLADGAEPLHECDLPAELAVLGRYQGLKLRNEESDHDVARIEEAVARKLPWYAHRKGRLAAIGAGLVTTGGAVALTATLLTGGPDLTGWATGHQCPTPAEKAVCFYADEKYSDFLGWYTPTDCTGVHPTPETYTIRSVRNRSDCVVELPYAGATPWRRVEPKTEPEAIVPADGVDRIQLGAP